MARRAKVLLSTCGFCGLSEPDVTVCFEGQCSDCYNKASSPPITPLPNPILLGYRGYGRDCVRTCRGLYVLKFEHLSLDL